MASISPPVLVYHASARSIVFRDHVRRSMKIEHNESLTSIDESDDDSIHEVEVTPLPRLDFEKHHEFELLIQSDNDKNEMTDDERIVLESVVKSKAVVKTIKHDCWEGFLKRLSMDDVFRSSTSLLPEGGMRMRCYGQSLDEYPTGVIFRLPEYASLDEESEDAEKNVVWCFPAGYAARTEYNIDSRGNLINGRDEALVSLKRLRELNDSYLNDSRIVIAGKLIDSDLLETLPYNEVFVKIGPQSKDHIPSFEHGLGPPISLFLRSATYNHLVSTLRNRARMAHWLKIPQSSIPILLIHPSHGVKVLTRELQSQLWQRLARNVNPFQNQMIWHKTQFSRTDEKAFDQKYQELFDLESDEIKSKLTSEECARIAGGFGATDESVANLLRNAALQQTTNSSGSSLQGIVNEGLTAALRAGDYHTSRQLLILYSLIAKTTHQQQPQSTDKMKYPGLTNGPDIHSSKSPKDIILAQGNIPSTPPPPPLDTDRLRSATNSDGLLAVLGAAQVLRAMQDGSARRKVQEVVSSLEEWVEMADHNLTFRIKSWNDQRVAQGDLEIATENDTAFSAFLGTKAISNRRTFVNQLKKAVSDTNFVETLAFLKCIYDIVQRMHSPCLRLELLQYILGLDNRYSVAHVARSVELAATCLTVDVVSTDDAIVKT